MKSKGSRFGKKKKRPHLFVGIPAIDGKITLEVHRYVAALQVASAIGTLPFTVSCGELSGVAPVEFARNVLCGMALKTDAELIMMIDADMLPAPNVSRLLFNAGDIVVPRMYRFRDHQKGKPELTCCATVIQDGERLDLTPELDASGAYNVDFVGTGCIVIKRKVLEDPKMRVGEDENGVPALFRTERNQTGRVTNWEDVDFTLRASKLGYSVVVDFDARCGHKKTVNLDTIADLVYSRPEKGEKRISDASDIMSGAAGAGL